MPFFTLTLLPKYNSLNLIVDLTAYVDNETPSDNELADAIIYHFDGMNGSEILSFYRLIAIERLPDCNGCRNDSLGQRAHMECPTGCLHDKDDCSTCILSTLDKTK